MLGQFYPYDGEWGSRMECIHCELSERERDSLRHALNLKEITIKQLKEKLERYEKLLLKVKPHYRYNYDKSKWEPK